MPCQVVMNVWGRKKKKQNEGVEIDRKGYFRKGQLGKTSRPKEQVSELRPCWSQAVNFADVQGKCVLPKEWAGAKALRQPCAWYGEPARKWVWLGWWWWGEVGQEVAGSQMLGLQLVLHNFPNKCTHALSFLSCSLLCPLPCQATRRKNREGKSTAKTQPWWASTIAITRKLQFSVVRGNKRTENG